MASSVASALGNMLTTEDVNVAAEEVRRNAAEWNNLTRKQKRARKKKMKRKQKRVCECSFICVSMIDSHCFRFAG